MAGEPLPVMGSQNGLFPVDMRMEKESKAQNKDRGIVDLFKIFKLLIAINSELVDLRTKVTKLLAMAENLKED
ncbi:MAG: hypothetical protein V3V31_10890 [Methylococcales bacterium]